jgi:hypothetical protein
MKRILKIGDIVYCARGVWSGEQVPCPVCEGTTRLLVKPDGAPDELGTLVTCDYCKQYTAQHPPAGTVVEQWNWKPHVDRLRIDRVLCTQGPAGDTYEYHANLHQSGGGSSSWTTVKDWFETEAEARIAAERMAEAATEKGRIEKIDTIRRGRGHGCGWTIGYSKREIADLTEQIECHQKAIHMGKAKRTKPEKKELK